MAHRLTWKRAKCVKYDDGCELRQHMTHCGRYWFEESDSVRLWHEDSGNIVGYFDSTPQAKSGAQRPLEALHNPNVFTCNASVDGPLSPGYYGN